MTQLDQVSITLHTGMSLDHDTELLLIGGLLNYVKNRPEVDTTAIARGLRYVADKITQQPQGVNNDTTRKD